jgi:Lon protease-like protein
MQQGWLPLFPLQVVLFPGAQLPLHIFEDRYKEMIAEVVEGREEFGVVLANEKGIVSTGCTATVDTVLRKYPDGRMDILTRGRRRFEIRRINDDRNFLRGEVDFFDDDESAPAEAGVRESAIQGYNQLQALISHDPLDAGLASEAQLSFRLVQPVADLTFRQLLLASRSEAERIRRLAEYFPAHLIRQQHARSVRDSAPRNGHGHPPGGIQ